MAIVENPLKGVDGYINTKSKGFRELCRDQYMHSMYTGELDNGLLTVLIAFPHLTKKVKASMGVRHIHNLARAVVYSNGEQYLMLWHRSTHVAELYEVIWDPDETGSYKIELSWMSKSAAYSLKAIYNWLSECRGHGLDFKVFATRTGLLSRCKDITCVYETESLSLDNKEGHYGED